MKMKSTIVLTCTKDNYEIRNKIPASCGVRIQKWEVTARNVRHFKVLIMYNAGKGNANMVYNT